MNRPQLILAAAVAVLACCAGLPAVAAKPAVWTRYVNARHGFSIEYPAGAFIPERGADNGDGRRYKAIRGGARFLVWAGRNAQKQSPREWVERMSASCRQGRAHYAVTAKAMAVVTCERRKEIFYSKRLWTGGKVTGFQMTYPTSERGRWDMALSRMSDSLKAAK